MTNHEFVHEQRAVRVVFRRGASDDLPAEVLRLGAERVLLIGSPRHAARMSRTLGDRVAVFVPDPRIHVPLEQVEAVRADADRTAVDVCVAVGGGSAIGLAKAVALHRPVPILAVPTTLSGSEMTRVWGITSDGMKRTGRDPLAAPRTVLYDPSLVATLPIATAVPSAMNALAHAAEALWAPDRSPMTDLFAAEGAAALGRALKALADGPSLKIMSDALFGAWLSGICLDSTTMSLHHKLCHVLGGSFGLPHAPTHAVLLPHLIAFNRDDAPHAEARLADALGFVDPATGLHELIGGLGGPTSLGDLGLRAEDLDRAAELALASSYGNPRALSKVAVRALLQRAQTGASPAGD